MQGRSNTPSVSAPAGGAAVLARAAGDLRPAAGHAGTMEAAIRTVVGEAAVRTGRVKLEMPPLVENGNTVPMTCRSKAR